MKLELFGRGNAEKDENGIVPNALMIAPIRHVGNGKYNIAKALAVLWNFKGLEADKAVDGIVRIRAVR